MKRNKKLDIQIEDYSPWYTLFVSLFFLLITIIFSSYYYGIKEEEDNWNIFLSVNKCTMVAYREWKLFPPQKERVVYKCDNGKLYHR